MPKKIIVGAVVRIEQPAEEPTATFLAAARRGSTIHFETGETARLAPNDPMSAHYAEFLDEARRLLLPVYIEVEPKNATISRLLFPLVATVAGVRVTKSGDAEIVLEISQAKHLVRAGNPDKHNLLKALRDAKRKATTVLVTETDEHEIIHVTGAPHPPSVAAPAPGRAPRAKSLAQPCVTLDRANALFDLVALQTCQPVTVSPPCIPFLYPDDGCWGRAHQMCRLILAAGETPKKTWIYGRLRVRTKNNPNCSVSWGWHVAPTLCITGESDDRVLDPSMFDAPVTVAVWRGAQGDPRAVLASTDASIFYRSSAGATQTDPTYAQTAQVLTTYRLKLKLRSLGALGPPPYANCP